jgi:SAM-dependent methyltransferase
VSNAWIYDQVQDRIAKLGAIRERVRAEGASFSGSVLDVGAGTGNFLDVLPAQAEYVGIDPDPAKIERLTKKFPEVAALVADGTNLPFDHKSFDYAVCIDVSHHLDASQLRRLVAEAARVTRRELLFIDAIWIPRSAVSRALWAIDRGRFPRSAETMLAALREHFELVSVDYVRFSHRYVIVHAKPLDELSVRGEPASEAIPAR